MSKPLQKTKKIKGNDVPALPFTKINYLLFFAGVITLIVGYITLSIGPWDSFMSLTLSPILLVLAYCVLIPVAILYRRKDNDETVTAGNE